MAKKQNAKHTKYIIMIVVNYGEAIAIGLLAILGALDIIIGVVTFISNVWASKQKSQE